MKLTTIAVAILKACDWDKCSKVLKNLFNMFYTQ